MSTPKSRYLSSQLRECLDEITAKEIDRLKSVNKELVETSKRYYEITMNPKKFSDDMYESAKYELEQALKKAGDN